MTTEDALLQDILANPSDDTPRLIYADWLDEHGQPERAEFIRVQCKLEEVSRRLHDLQQPEREGDYDFWSALQRRERELLRHENVEKWGRVDCFGDDLEYVASPVTNYNFDPPKVSHGVWAIHEAGHGAVPKIDFNFRRGFVAEVTLTCDDCMRHGPELVKAAPLEDVRLSNKEPLQARREGREEWRWGSMEVFGTVAAENLGLNPNLLPAVIFAHFPKRVLRTFLRPHVIVYAFFSSREDALSCASQACLAWARSQTTVTLAGADTLWDDARYNLKSL